MSDEFEEINNELNELIEKFEDCLSSGEGCFFDSEELLEVIDYYFAVEEKSKLKSAIDLALSLYPSEIDLIIRKAQYISQSKSPEEAISFLERYRKTNTEDSDLLFALAALYSQAGQTTKAIESYEYLLSQDDDDIEVYISLGEEYMTSQKYEYATKIYRKALNLEPINDVALQSFAFCSQFIEKPNKSIIYLKKLCKQNPFSEQNWIAYGLLLYYTENFFDAITAFDLSIAIDEEIPTAHLYRAQSLIALENYQEGITALHEALKLIPEEPIIHFFLGQAYEKQSNYTTAALYYKDCIKYDKYNADAWIGVAMCYFELNDFHSAEPYIQKAIEIEPTNIHFRLAYAEMLYKEGYFEKGEELYQALYEEGDELAIVTINWAMAMSSNEKLMDAIHLLRETIENNQFDEPSIYFTLIELSLKEPYLKDHLEDYLFKLFLEFDVSSDMLKQYCPTLLTNPQYETLIKTYIDEKD